MGKILQIYNDNRDLIIRGLSQNVPKIVKLLKEKGVYREDETHDLLTHESPYVVYNIFKHVNDKGYYAEFVDALTEAGEHSVADLVKRADCSFSKKLGDRNVADIGSDVTLSCRLDKEYVVRWYKDQSEIFMNDKFQISIKDERRKHQLIIVDIQEEDSGDYSCECGTTKTSCKLNVEGDCSFTTTLEDRNVIDIGSDVTLSCCLDKEYGVRWYKDQCEIFMNDKFHFADERWKHQLIIADIQEEDSGVYSCKCETTETSCILKVEECSFTTKLEDRNVVEIGSDVTLSCCLDKEYGVQWYKDQCEISMNDKFQFKDERRKHQLIIADIQEEDSGVYSCECGTTETSCILNVEECSFTTKLEDRNVVDIGSDVTLSCCLEKEYGVQWYKDQCEISMNDKFQFKDERRKHQLIIADIQEEDSGVYSCECGTTETSCILKVEECSFTTKLEDRNVVDIGSDVTLSCCLDKEYGVQWYKDQCEISMNDKFQFKDERRKHQLIIADIQEEDSGVYSCECGTTETSCILKVEECSFTTKLEDRNVVDIGSDVTLSCCLEKEYGVQWYKDQCEISMNEKFQFKDERRKHQLIIADIQEEDSGVYSCECGTTETSCILNVKECSFTTKLEDRNVVDIGSDVTLSCCLEKEYGVQWYKDQCEISMNEKFQFKDERRKHQLIIADIQEEDSGVYSCECGTTETSCILNVKECSFTTKLEDRNVVDIGSDVTLSCCLEKEYGVQWYKDQCEISMNEKFQFKDERRKHQLIIADIQEEDSGVYSCECGTTETSCILNVKECSFTTKLEDRNVVDFGSDVTLSCCLDKEYGVQWYKDQCEISMNEKFQFKDERKKHQIIIADIQEEDSGVYSCECGTTETSCILKVEDCSFIRKLEDRNVIGIGSDVTLSCCLDKEYSVRWYKYRDEIILSDKFKSKDERLKHKLIIADIQEEDSGVYSCECGRTKTSCELKVEANRFIKQLEDVTITEGQNLILACELNAECEHIEWYKNNGDISYGTIITDFERADSNAHRYKLEINRVRIEDAGKYSCSNENIITTCHVTVKEKKEPKLNALSETTTLLSELNSAKQQLEVTKDELLNTKKEFDRTETDRDKKKSIIELKDKEIKNLRALLKEKGNTVRSRENELENKEICNKELKDENQRLAESLKEFKSICKELKSTKKLLAQMIEQIKKLEAEKKHMEGRVNILESYIKNSNEQQQKVSEQLLEANKQQKKLLEDIKAEMEEHKKSKIMCSVS